MHSSDAHQWKWSVLLFPLKLIKTLTICQKIFVVTLNLLHELELIIYFYKTWNKALPHLFSNCSNQHFYYCCTPHVSCHRNTREQNNFCQVYHCITFPYPLHKPENWTAHVPWNYGKYIIVANHLQVILSQWLIGCWYIANKINLLKKLLFTTKNNNEMCIEISWNNNIINCIINEYQPTHQWSFSMLKKHLKNRIKWYELK